MAILIRLHPAIQSCFHATARNLTLKTLRLPGITHFTKATVLPPSTSTGRTYFPMWFATEEQAVRGKCQIVHVMHRCEHIDSYEIFREEIDREEQEMRMEVGLKEVGLKEIDLKEVDLKEIGLKEVGLSDEDGIDD